MARSPPQREVVERVRDLRTRRRSDAEIAFLTGKLALQADGSVVAVMGGTEVLATATATRKPREGAYGGVVTAGPGGNFEPGTVAAFAKGQFYLVRLRDGAFLALSRKCTHLGCTVPWSEVDPRFACPCHASSFSETGEVLSAPAPRPLDLYRVFLEDGVVKVDTSVAITRDRFEPSQAVRG